jgi:vesicle-fusing ATPase
MLILQLVDVGFASVKKFTETPYDQDMLADVFIKQFENQVFAPGQRLIMDHKNIPLAFTVKTVQLVDLRMEKSSGSAPTVSTPTARGILTRHTPITFYKDAKSPIKLKGSSKRPAANSIIAPDFKFEVSSISLSLLKLMKKQSTSMLNREGF